MPTAAPRRVLHSDMPCPPLLKAVSTVAEECVHRCDTACRLFCALIAPSLPGRAFHSAGMVISVCWNGGHGVLERWTRGVGTVDTRGVSRAGDLSGTSEP
ncbi:hypothetical protein [Kibdelosporangium philippinense]|uniref:hypothetical protein n=1 Tax=Kibdelosporangium philippinense TaxID=211113 RepID=UPI003613C16E